jgi:hypothetical protein
MKSNENEILFQKNLEELDDLAEEMIIMENQI